MREDLFCSQVDDELHQSLPSRILIKLPINGLYA